MQSHIEELQQILPPPNSPKNNTGDWAAVESSLGIALPSDYKEFTKSYGSVKICNYLIIHTAFPWSDECKEFLLTLNQEYDAVVNGRSNIPYPDFPATGGLLPFGGTDSADIFSWITEGSPDDWGIFVWKFPGLKTYTFKNLNLSGFLVDLVSMRSPLFPKDMPPTFFSPERRGLVVTS